MHTQDLWRSVLQRLQPTISRANFVTWFQHSAVLELTESGCLRVGVPTAFARDWIASKYATKILQAAKELDSAVLDVELAVEAALADSDTRAVDARQLAAAESDKSVRKIRNQNAVTVTAGGAISAALHAGSTFAQFVPCEENRLAHAASVSVARRPGQTYNPLVIYGGVGLGKTHLLNAIGHETLACDATKKVVYLTAEMFTNEFVAATKKLKTDEFRRRYRDADVLLLDDVQFFEGREKTQEEFFNLFNALHAAGKQICVTSDRPPSELAELMDRLRSRLSWGLIAQVEAPGYESRLAILESKTRQKRAILDPEVLQFVALNVTGSVRELEGVLNRALAEADLLDRQPTVRRVAQIIEQLDRRERLIGAPARAEQPEQARTPQDFIELTARHFGLSPQALSSDSRTKDIKTARGVAMYLIRDQLGLGLADIGRRFSRNHATVLHAIQRINDDLKSDAALLRRVNAVKAELGL